MTIEVIVKHGEELAPLGEGGARCVVASNGIFLERRTRIFTTCSRVTRLPMDLASHSEACVLHVPPIPAEHARAMLGFFRAAFDLHGGEAALILLYDPARRHYRWHCPAQTVELRQNRWGEWRATLEVEFEDPFELPSGYVVFGDAHSHADHSAYASLTDQHEERYKDGIHIVAGRVHRAVPDLHIDFVMDGRRFAFAPEGVFAPGRLAPLRRVPPGWLERIRIEKRSHGS
jgi:PRTRC genetic system protein A